MESKHSKEDPAGIEKVERELRLREEELKVVGMHCATCVRTVSKAIMNVKGVREAEVNLASGQARVVLEGGKLAEIVDSVRKVGYDVLTQRVILRVRANEDEAERLREKVEGMRGVVRAGINAASGQLSVEINPLTTSPQEVLEGLREAGYEAKVVEGSVLSEVDQLRREVVDMGLRLAVGSVFSALTLLFQYSGEPFLSLLASIPVMVYSGRGYFRGAWRALRNRVGNMDTLVSLSSGVAWVYSLYSLLTGGRVFFDTSTLLITLVLVGKTIESYLRYRTSTWILKLQVSWANRLEGGREVRVSSDSLRVGDIVVVRGGEVIPADGVVEEGKGYVDESIYTGEAVPVMKVKGDPVVGGSILKSGALRVYVTRAGNRTYLSQVIASIREAQTARMPVQRLVDRVSSFFVPLVIGAALISGLTWHLLGYPPRESILFAVAVLASACPCALGLATPMALLVSVQRLAKAGVKVRDGKVLEVLNRVRTFVLDKTGTITKGEFRIEARELIPGALEMASSLERLSDHPVARAISSLSSGSLKVDDFQEFQEGVYGLVNGRAVLVGKRSFVERNCGTGESEADVLVCIESKVGAEIWIRDELREETREVIGYLRKRFRVVIATGDPSAEAERIGRELGVEVHRNLSPEEKAQLVRRLRAEGPVAFVGDGVNDAEALREADVGIAISTGTDLAKYAGQVVIPSLKDLPELLNQAKRTLRKVKQNLGWAFGYNALLIPLSAGVLYPIIYLPPEFAALAMSMSSVLVSLWSLT